MAEHSIALPLRLAHTLARRKSSYDKPPTDPAELEIEKPFLRRTSTLQSYVDGEPKLDPFNPARARFLQEPEQFFEDVQTTVSQIEGLAEADWAKIPKPSDISRSTTGLETPSRTSSIDSVACLVTPNRRKNGLEHIFDNILPRHEPVNGPRSDIISCAPSTHSSPSAFRAGSSRRSSAIRAQGGTVRGTTRAPSSSHPTFIQGEEPERASKRLKTEGTAQEEAETNLRRPLGCPMCKANRKYYERVHGPCTDLRGISPKTKALMEHLKKQHSSANRCLQCYKWHNNAEELAKHQQGKEGHHRCNKCCHNFKEEKEYLKHKQGPSCELDPRTRPELFTKQQETAFEAMKHKSSSKGSIEQKYRWCFGKLFPNHPEKDTIWPYYDFAILTHNLPFDKTPEFLEQYAGGLRQDQSSATSPSDQIHALSTPTPTPTPVPEWMKDASQDKSPDQPLDSDLELESAQSGSSDSVGATGFSSQGHQFVNDDTIPSNLLNAPDLASTMLMTSMGYQPSIATSPYTQLSNHAPPMFGQIPRHLSYSTTASFKAPSMTRSTSHSTHPGILQPPGTPTIFPMAPPQFAPYPSRQSHGFGNSFEGMMPVPGASAGYPNQSHASFEHLDMTLPQMGTESEHYSLQDEQSSQMSKQQAWSPASTVQHHNPQQSYHGNGAVHDSRVYTSWDQPPSSQPPS